MNESVPGDGMDRLEPDDTNLKQAFQQMETQAAALQVARASGDQSAFDQALTALRRAQVTFLRELNKFPADTARFLAERQGDLLDGVALDALAELSPDDPPDAPTPDQSDKE